MTANVINLANNFNKVLNPSDEVFTSKKKVKLYCKDILSYGAKFIHKTVSDHGGNVELLLFRDKKKILYPTTVRSDKNIRTDLSHIIMMTLMLSVAASLFLGMFIMSLDQAHSYLMKAFSILGFIVFSAFTVFLLTFGSADTRRKMKIVKNTGFSSDVKFFIQSKASQVVGITADKIYVSARSFRMEEYTYFCWSFKDIHKITYDPDKNNQIVAYKHDGSKIFELNDYKIPEGIDIVKELDIRIENSKTRRE